MLICLSEEEFQLAKQIGQIRQAEAEKKKLPDRHGFSGLNGEAIHIQGACGELAAAIALNLKWDKSVNTFKTRSDLSGKIEVRTRSKPHYDLIVRENDSDEAYFVLVTRLSEKEYQIRGFILGQDAKQKEFLHDYGNRPPAFFIPAEKLEPISKLQEKIK